jgi:uncharacterized protein YggT (Ycf19 family)
MLPDAPEAPKPSPAQAPVTASDRIAQVIWVVFGLIEALVALRVILRLLAANPDAGFTNLIYSLSQPFVALFQGVFPVAARQGNVLELSSVLALIVYPIVSWAIVHLVQTTGRRQTTVKP